MKRFSLPFVMILWVLVWANLGIAESTQWQLPANVPGSWSTAANWSAGEPTAELDAEVSGIVWIEEEGEVCRDLGLGEGLFGSAGPGMAEMFSGSLTSRREYIGILSMGHFLQMGGVNTTNYMEIRKGSLYEYRAGSLRINDGLKLAGIMDLHSQPVTVSMGNALVDLSEGYVFHGKSATFSAGPESLVIYKAGVSPDAFFGTFSCQGLLHQAGQRLTVPADRTIRGTGTIKDMVECSGRIYASEGGFINLDGGLRATRQAEIDLGSGAVTFGGYNQEFDSQLKAKNVRVRLYDEWCRFTQGGGILQAQNLNISKGSYRLTGGTVRITKTDGVDPTFPFVTDNSQLQIETTFYLGNSETSGTIDETGEGQGANLWIGKRSPFYPSTNSTFQGWGTVSLTGSLSNYGQVIADGYGKDRTLDMSSFSSVGSGLLWSPDTFSSGCFARNHGKLVLPILEGEGNSDCYTWGDSQTAVKRFDDETGTIWNEYFPPNSINSMQLDFVGLSEEDEMSMALLATDRDDLPELPESATMIGIWEFKPSDEMTFDAVNLTIRYDDLLAGELGLAEHALKVYCFEDGLWRDVTSGINLEKNWIYANDLTGFSLVAVGVPEPGTVMLLMAGAGLLRRGRRFVP